jgi:5-enolpyruvylshikimate-3-phosphate synthase
MVWTEVPETAGYVANSHIPLPKTVKELNYNIYIIRRRLPGVKWKYQPTRFRVEGDWSSASYLLALGALAGEVEVDNLPKGSLQGDRMILRFLQEMGAKITAGNNSVIVQIGRAHV